MCRKAVPCLANDQAVYLDYLVTGDACTLIHGSLKKHTVTYATCQKGNLPVLSHRLPQSCSMNVSRYQMTLTANKALMPDGNL